MNQIKNKFIFNNFYKITKLHQYFLNHIPSNMVNKIIVQKKRKLKRNLEQNFKILINILIIKLLYTQLKLFKHMI